MHTTQPQQQSLLIPVATATARLGLRDATHFRRHVAARLGIKPIKLSGRWMVGRESLEKAIAGLDHEQTIAPAQSGTVR